MAKKQKKEVLIEDILQLTDQLFRQLLPILPTEWIHLDLTMSQLKIVLLLFITGHSRMGDIASELGVSLATATGVVDRLVERKLLIRNGDPDDRRVVLCQLSNKGEKLLRDLWQLSQKRIGYLMSALDTPQLLLISQALQALMHASEDTKDVPQKD
ncbi:MAG: MarR family transcriptional regulator [Dehalococcoidia bacterium]|nr:MarR family transcriptional regulator [Dehalococcoidia bacterium]